MSLSNAHAGSSICSQPLNYQPQTAGTLQCLALTCCKDSAKPSIKPLYNTVTQKCAYYRCALLNFTVEKGVLL